MTFASELLRSYIRILRRLSGAECVSLFVPAAVSGSAPAMLLHDGEIPVPELRDLDAAVDSWSRASAAVTPGQPTAPTSGAPDCALVPLPSAWPPWASVPEPERSHGERGRRRTDPTPEEAGGPPAAWLGMRFAPGSAPAEKLPPKSLPHGTPEDTAAWWWTWLLALGGELAGHAMHVSVVLRDPVTGVPARAAFQGVLSEELEKARLTGRRLCLLLVNPDDFAAINQRVGREAGDEIIRELVARLRAALRSADLVAKYGGVVYGAVLLDTGVDVARDVAAKALQSLAKPAYGDGLVSLQVSVGVAAFEPDDETVRQPLDLIRRADQALNAAKRAGGGRVAVWEAGWRREDVGHLDPMTGIFTGNMASDYRNMVLLWDAVRVMAASDEFTTLAEHVLGKLYGAFEPDRVALLVRSKGASSLLTGLGRAPAEGHAPQPLAALDLTSDQQAFVAAAGEPGRVSAGVHVGPGRRGVDESYAYYVPLVARKESLGGLYLDRPDPLDSADLMFLEALAAPLAVALDRARLAEQERVRQEQEQRRLRAEVDELRSALQRAKLEYRSPEMEEVLATTRRVAPTDATVLIMGESGTGKELLARTIHELSPRRHKPLVVVDCSAIASSLADSELFGHERGAYTGAQEGRQGRLAEAAGGTVLLDEIGELPLEVQSKLLRFVQEKQLTAVGSTRLRGVDVRIIAATNRQLDREVVEGRFRGDLYHRLNVVKLVVPPLRERPEDILYLAGHFIATYAALYRKAVRHLAPEAEALLLSHSWPGNVRELQNRVLQAVILCAGEKLGPGELGLPDAAEAPAPPPPANAPASALPDGASAWERLRRSLAQQVDLALAGPTPRPMPFGRWLTADAALEASAVASGVARRAAGLLGVPETTFRRLLRRATDEAASGLAARPGSWEAVRVALRELLRRGGPQAGVDLVDRLEHLLLNEVLERTADDDRVGSVLMGLSLPTFRIRAQAYRSRGSTV
jgi:hydrogenase-4 transcriptional activator